MWVTSVDNYQQDGVIFKGNVRNKDPSAAYAKMKQRLAVSSGTDSGRRRGRACDTPALKIDTPLQAGLCGRCRTCVPVFWLVAT